MIGLAWLTPDEELDGWTERWSTALVACFPREAGALATIAGDGLRKLIASRPALDEAHHALASTLLAQQGVDLLALRATAERLLVYAIEPLAEQYR